MAILSNILLIASVMVLTGCGETSSSLSLTAPASAIVVLPGYSSIRHASGAGAWSRPRVDFDMGGALFGSRSLVLPLWRLGLPEGIELEAAGILSEVPVLPFYSVDAYGTLLDTLRRTHGRHSMIVPFAYDWRGDLLEAVKQLHQTVTDLRNQGVNRIGLVAHSMGGLIAAYYLRYGTQDFDQTDENWAGAAQVDAVVLAGVPYGGSMFTFRNMQYGRKIGMNKALLSEAVASFPSSYYLLPSPELDVLLASLDPLRGMIYDISCWKENEWGLLWGSSRFLQEVLSNRLVYTEY